MPFSQKYGMITFEGIFKARTAGLVLGIATSAYGVNLCKDQETVYFSCGVEAGKVVSLCGTSTDERLTDLRYRFGKKESIAELIFPNEKVKGSVSKFTQNSYTRPLVSYIEIGFINYNYEYRVFRRRDENESADISYGVSVRKLGKKQNETLEDIVVNCQDEITDNLHDLTNQLECDRNSALGCAE